MPHRRVSRVRTGLPTLASLRRRRQRRGQGLVEFALVFPIFFVLFMGIVEFAFAFNAILSVNFATRDAALLAAEAGRQSGADCAILSTIEGDVKSPAKITSITKVDIYRATDTGAQYSSGEIQTYTRTGSLTCTMPDLTSKTLPYTLSTSGYPYNQRCDYVAGCTGMTTTHSTVDSIGVRVWYTHRYVTPLRTFVSTGATFSFTRSNAMRIEPTL